MQKSYRETISFEERKKEATKVIAKYPTRIPVIIEKLASETALPVIKKSKFLCPADMEANNLMLIVRKKLKLSSAEALFMFVKGKVLVPSSSLLGELYVKYKDEDSYLYINYCSENVFG